MDDHLHGYINKLDGKTPTVILDAWLHTWHLIETDIGLVHAKTIEWKRAYGRVDWLVQTLGDEHPSTKFINATRFHAKDDPPIRAKPGNQKGRRERTLQPTPQHDHAGNPEIQQLRNPNDPIATDLARASNSYPRKRKRKRRRRATS